jgi:hypothetical protein
VDLVAEVVSGLEKERGPAQLPNVIPVTLGRCWDIA